MERYAELGYGLDPRPPPEAPVPASLQADSRPPDIGVAGQTRSCV